MSVPARTPRAARGVAIVATLALFGGCASPERDATTAPTTPSAASPSPSVVSAPPSASSAPSFAPSGPPSPITLAIEEFAVPAGSHPHDVSPAVDGGVWYTGQRTGVLGHLDPESGTIREIALGTGSSPHGVITGPDGAPWITDSGLNGIVRVDPATDAVRTFPLPAERPGANLNTAVFDAAGTLWFTGQAGVYGRLDPSSGEVEVFDAPGGRGPYGITATPDGAVWYASLAGNHIARIDPESGAATVVEPPTADQGARRAWSDSSGRLWVSEWQAGQVAVHDPADGSWREWRLPGASPMAYAVFVDDRDIVWLTDFGANAIVRFDPVDETFETAALPDPGADVRQLHGRPGEVWGAESGLDRLVVVTGG